MKYFIFFLSAMVMMLSACLKDDDSEQKEEERRKLEAYLLDNNITQEPTGSGMYYLEEVEGTGVSPRVDDLIELVYTGTLIDGTVVETTDSAEARDARIYSDSRLYGPHRYYVQPTDGFFEGIRKMKEDGEATFIIPSDLAYGGSRYGSIPPYSTLIYHVKLLDVILDTETHEQELINEFIENDTLEYKETDGVYVAIIEEGEGELMDTGNEVAVQFTGYFLDGRVFDTNEGQIPTRFVIGSGDVIEGWDIAAKQMRRYTRARWIIEPDKAYGSAGLAVQYYGYIIPPEMTLVFDVFIAGTLK